MALSVVFTKEEYNGFVGRLATIKETKEFSEPTDIIGYPTTMEEANEIIRAATVADSGTSSAIKIKDGNRLILYVDATKADLKGQLEQSLRRIGPSSHVFLIESRSNDTNVIDILRRIDDMARERGQESAKFSKTRAKRFFVSAKIDLPEGFFNLGLGQANGPAFGDLSESLKIYLISQTIGLIEIPQSHLPKWDIFRKILIAA